VPIFEVSSLPRFVHRANPIYPPAMKQQSKEGTVLIEALVDATGKVRKVEVIQSAGQAFDQAAIAAIQGSTFIPAKTNGKPVPVLLRVPIRFRLR
jgi:TonB family protein